CLAHHFLGILIPTRRPPTHAQQLQPLQQGLVLLLLFALFRRRSQQQSRHGEEHQTKENGNERRRPALVSPRPQPEAPRHPCRSCLRRLTAQPATQVVGERPRRGVTPTRVFLQRLQTNRLQVALDGGIHLRWGRRRFIPDLLFQRGGRGPPESLL